MEKVKKKKKELSVLQQIFIDAYIVFIILTVLVLIVFLFDHSFFKFLQLSLGITLILMGILNSMIIKEKSMTIWYYLIGVGCLIFFVLSLLGVA